MPFFPARPKPRKMSASRTIIDVPTILDPSSGGKKRRRDEDSDVAEDATDARSMARLISTVLSGPHPAPVVTVPGNDDEAGGANGGTGAEGQDTAGKSGEEKSAGDKTGVDDKERPASKKIAKPDRKAELRAQIAAARAENEAIDARRRDIFGAYANLSSVYNYGLSHIAKLNDLSGAPDNTLPGNQPKETASGDKKE